VKASQAETKSHSTELVRLREEVAKLREENRRLKENPVQATGATFRLPAEADWLKVVARIFEQHRALEDVLVELAVELRNLVQVEDAAVFTVLSEKSRLVAHVPRHSNSNEVAVQLRIGQGIAGWVAKEGRSANLKDLEKDDRTYRPLLSKLGVRPGATLAVPIFDRSGVVTGVIQLWNPIARRYFSLHEEALIKAMAAVLGVLIESSRLFMSELKKNIELREMREELESRVSELDRLYDFSKRMTGLDSLEEELILTADAALTMVPSQICLVSIIDDGEPTSWIAGPETGQALRLWKEGRGECYRSVISGCSARRLKGDEIDEIELFESLDLDRKSHVIVPLHVDGRCIGAIELLNRKPSDDPNGSDGFRNPDIRLLTVLAGQFSGMIANNLARRERERNERIGAIGSMVGGIFHDLKTPLTIASGYVQLMERSDDEKARAKFRSAVQKQFDHIQQMIKEVVAYARGDIEVYERNVHLSLFARELNEWLTQEFEGFDIQVSVDAEFEGDARFDEGKLKRILFNLARNAREAMGDNGGTYRVVIERSDDDMLEFRCVDNGPGIPEHVQQRLFEAFVSSGKAARSGLGLAIVKKLVTEMNGEVSFQSEVGVGTEFIISLPWNPVVEEKTAATAAE
jgi:signal transduction histidine kinase